MRLLWILLLIQDDIEVACRYQPGDKFVASGERGTPTIMIRYRNQGHPVRVTMNGVDPGQEQPVIAVEAEISKR